MALTADDVVEKRFKRALQGYDRAEVDDFLDKVADRLSELDAEVARLQRDPAPAPTPTGVEGAPTEDILSRTLIAAQRTADATVAEARAEAERLVAEAQRGADDTHQRTAAQADALREEVRRQVQERRDDLRVTLERVQQAVEELQRTRSAYVGRVRDVLAEQLSALERAGEIPELPERLRDLARIDTEPRIAELLAADVEPAPRPAQGDATAVLSPPAGAEAPAETVDAASGEAFEEPTGEFPQSPQPDEGALEATGEGGVDEAASSGRAE